MIEKAALLSIHVLGYPRDPKALAASSNASSVSRNALPSGSGAANRRHVWPASPQRHNIRNVRNGCRCFGCFVCCACGGEPPGGYRAPRRHHRRRMSEPKRLHTSLSVACVRPELCMAGRVSRRPKVGRVIRRATAGALPDFVPPQLTALTETAPEGSEWIHVGAPRNPKSSVPGAPSLQLARDDLAFSALVSLPVQPWGRARPTQRQGPRPRHKPASSTGRSPTRTASSRLAFGSPYAYVQTGSPSRHTIGGPR